MKEEIIKGGSQAHQGSVSSLGKEDASTRNICLQIAQRLFQGSLSPSPTEISKLPSTEMPFNNTDHQA